jgi:hypothetical protein
MNPQKILEGVITPIINKYFLKDEVFVEFDAGLNAIVVFASARQIGRVASLKAFVAALERASVVIGSDYIYFRIPSYENS